MARIFCRVILAACTIGNFTSASFAAPQAGTAVAVVQSASAMGNGGTRTLKAGMQISLGERIKTNARGQVQLIFTDDTKMVVGPNSSLVIEAYLFRSKSTVNKFAVKALGGSFRFITGKSPKNAYSIKTPAATIGIRGTSFDLTVGRGGNADIVLLKGEAEICGNGSCVRLEKSCSLASAPRKGGVNVVQLQRQRDQMIRARFPYIVSQAPLRRDFRLPTRSCGDLQRVRLGEVPEITGAIAPPAPEPEPEPEPPSEPGNPGNGGPQGDAGASPGGNDMGNPDRGRSDNNPGKGNK